MHKESLLDIGSSIQNHRKAEKSNYASIPAIGRALCRVKGTIGFNGKGVFWLTNKQCEYRNSVYSKDGYPVYKNTKMGEILSKYHGGSHQYQTRTNIGRLNTVDVEIFNRATYTITIDSVKDIIIYLNEENKENQAYRFQYLKQLIDENKELVDRLAELKRVEEEERKAQEEARKAKEEAERKLQEAEARRLAEEEQRRVAEEKRAREEIEKLNAKIQASQEKIKQTQSFIREGEFLREQHILDEFQEEAKRSHLFDNVPIVIEGGPGTGKTTTMIQRLKFLLSGQALTEYEAPLTEQQISFLTDPATRDKNWLFFSPTEKLLGFLRNNMASEELIANEENTTTLNSFCKKMLMSYRLRMPDSDGPFKLFKHKNGQETIIIDPLSVITAFEKFLVHRISAILLNISTLKTSDFPWHTTALQIKMYCKNAEKVKDINGLMRLLNTLQEKGKPIVRDQEKKLTDLKNMLALTIKDSIIKDESLKTSLTSLFLKWKNETAVTEETINENEMDESEDNEEENSNLDFEPKLYQSLKPLLRNLSLKTLDFNVKITPRQQELYDLCKSYIDSHDLSELAHLEWFKKHFAFPCRGIESNIFNQIPKLYKEFRKEQVKRGSTMFNLSLLQTILKKDNGKQIHYEELELLVGFINNMILDVYKKSKLRFESMKNNKYFAAYCENAKPVIGIDEATDYSMIDYYFMASFRHYEYSAVTLCGDTMQSLNRNGIDSWSSLKKYIFPQLEIYELKESYRQLPTLLDMSKQLYKDERGTDAPYSSSLTKREDEPSPICFISDDMETKTEWMARRINEIYTYYNGSMPSVAILVGDDVDIPEMIDIMEEQDILNGIEIHDCSGAKESNSKKCVRIFRLTEVKGMEFEVVFFYDIDTAIENHSQQMMRRYLYVGVSRATSHLAATFTKEKGNEGIIKYFDRSRSDWRLK